MVSFFDRILIALGFIALLTTEAILVNPNKPKAGFIVKTKGDTVACILKNIGNSDVKYKLQKDSAYHSLNIENAEEYDVPKKHLSYRAIVIPGGITPTFLHRLDSGKINVYALYERIGRTTHTHLYAIKGQEAVVKVFGYNKGLDNKQQLTKLVADNEQALSYLNSNRAYTEKLVVDCVNIYDGNNQNIRK